MIRQWIRGARPSPMEELETVVRDSPERVAQLVREELDVSQAVILLMALPIQLGEKIFKHLSDERAESFTRRAYEMEPFDSRKRDRVVHDALRRVRQI